MKNYEKTQGKIKNYLNALKERYSTTEWKDFTPNAICKEFGVTVTLPQLLKKGGYIYVENKKMLLSQKIFSLDVVQAHQKTLDYCNECNRKLAEKKKKAKERAKAKALKAEKAKNTQVTEPNVNNDLEWQRVYIPSHTYDIIKKQAQNIGMGLVEFLTYTFKQLSSLLESEDSQNEEPKQQPTIDELKKKIANMPEYKDFVNPKAKKSAGRPAKPQNLFSQNPAYLEALKNAVPAPTSYNPVYPTTQPSQSTFSTTNNTTSTNSSTNSSTISSEDKIKSLESIMNLFTNGIINKEELENLKFGILNK
jgi:hypothetical protein